MFLATRDALVINGSYPGFFTSSVNYYCWFRIPPKKKKKKKTLICQNIHEYPMKKRSFFQKTSNRWSTALGFLHQPNISARLHAHHQAPNLVEKARFFFEVEKNQQILN